MHAYGFWSRPPCRLAAIGSKKLQIPGSAARVWAGGSGRALSWHVCKHWTGVVSSSKRKADREFAARNFLARIRALFVVWHINAWLFVCVDVYVCVCVRGWPKRTHGAMTENMTQNLFRFCVGLGGVFCCIASAFVYIWSSAEDLRICDRVQPRFLQKPKARGSSSFAFFCLGLRSVFDCNCLCVYWSSAIFADAKVPAILKRESTEDVRREEEERR